MLLTDIPGHWHKISTLLRNTSHVISLFLQGFIAHQVEGWTWGALATGPMEWNNGGNIGQPQLERQKGGSLILEVLYQALHVAKFHLQLHLFLGQALQLPTEVVDVALEHVVYVAPSCLLLLQEAPFGLQNFVLLL